MSRNISREKRENLLAKIRELRAFLESANATPEMRAYLSELESELKRQKFGLVFEEHKEEIDEILETHTPILTEDKSLFIDNGGQMNFLIEGDNLAALTLLEKTHKGRIDVIYIDPPYNTGAKDWKYNNDYVDGNDLFRHSKWLSMMEKRLVIAKSLLSENGVLVVAIDKNEQVALSMLLESLFGQSYNFDCITIVHNPRGVQGKNFSYSHEYAIYVHPAGKKSIGERKIADEDIVWAQFRNWGGESLRNDAKNCFYPIIIKEGVITGFGDVVTDATIHPEQTEIHDGEVWVYPIDKNGVERKWTYARQSVEKVQHLLRAKKIDNRYEIVWGKNFASYKTVWFGNKYDASTYGSKIVNDLVYDNSFAFPKSLYNVMECIGAIMTPKNAVILDFFAGSGTTGHAVLELNQQDGGNRRFILCTNNENRICRDVAYERMKTVITGKRKDGSVYSDGLPASLKYQKIDFIPTSEQAYYDYANELLLHIRELVELENAINFEGNTDLAILLSEDEVDKFFADSKKLNAVKTIYLGHDIALSLEQQKILSDNSIALNIIPEYYYKEQQV